MKVCSGRCRKGAVDPNCSLHGRRGRVAQLDLYRGELGDDALKRQLAEAERGRCFYCWAPPGQPHTFLCSNRPEDEEAAASTQEEGLF